MGIGFLVALFVTFSGVFLYVEYFSRFGFYETLEMLQKGNLYGKVLALAAIPNLVVFFIFLKKKQDYRARGILMGVLLIACTTLLLKLI